ncbi:hypothetical protein RHGRI_001876 [Rhododendron griersonianum]|uniref:F-box domain-containing protein n=1 Tax=Rhododendron griersonianum TaxID=479676 RepID=A0AAV6LMT5_9ERIC|nr:hypothetical protein RHGRI_001876 [Rhododendron griersonianum]
MSYVDGEEEVENQFECLPDNVVVNIFDKLSDIKCLCRCFMVSKRFTSLVPLVQLVSIKTIFRCLSIYPSESMAAVLGGAIQGSDSFDYGGDWWAAAVVVVR